MQEIIQQDIGPWWHEPPLLLVVPAWYQLGAHAVRAWHKLLSSHDGWWSNELVWNGFLQWRSVLYVSAYDGPEG